MNNKKMIVMDLDGTLLNKKRKGILDEVHLKEKHLSRIDYLRYEMDRGNKE